MGTTATSLHVLSAVAGAGPRLLDDIGKAYRKLGYTRPKKAGAAAAKRVILAPDASGDWLSIYDSDNDRIDTGELKQLAVELTKKLGTCALLTSVYDSDSFEFVMFHMGKQVDAAVSDPEGHAGGLKMLKGARRARAWYSMFIGRDLPRAVPAGRQGSLLEYWEERLREPPAPATPFAEDELAAWCTLAGLSPENATTVPEDLVARDGPDRHNNAPPGAHRSEAAQIPGGADRHRPWPTTAPTTTAPSSGSFRRRGRGNPVSQAGNSGPCCAAAASRGCASASASTAPRRSN